MARILRRPGSLGAWIILAVGVTCAGTPAMAQDGLVTDGAQVQELATGFTFTEGPAADSSGAIYFTDIPAAKIHRWSLEGELSTFKDNTGRANGLMFDGEGNILACEMGNGRVSSIDKEGNATPLAEKYEGNRFNSPNDLWIHPNGGVYFTDPMYPASSDAPQGSNHVYYISPDRKSVTRVADDLNTPNGIVGTADGKILYVADLGANKTYVYDVGADATLKNKRLFVEMGSDGMTMDENGNVYLTRDRIYIYGPDGESKGAIETPQTPSNVVFGGGDGKTLFITARTGFYSIRMNVKGQ